MSHRILAALQTTHWAITHEALDTIVGIATRAMSDPEAVQLHNGTSIEGAGRARIRDGVAVVPVRGPLFRYANMFTQFSGATSMEVLATSIGVILDDPSVSHIIYDIDSPGGEVNGVQETARIIREASLVKPSTAFVSGRGQSGAYWLAAAAGEVVTGNTGVLGSIGAVISITDFRKAEEKSGIQHVEIVSSQSPKKRVDPTSPEGRSELQQIVDELGQVFVESVSDYRRIPVDRVLEDYGQGGSFVGRIAVEHGLADRVSTLEELVGELSTVSEDSNRPTLMISSTSEPSEPTRESTMSNENDTPTADAGTPTADSDATQSARAEGAAAERARILGIHALEADGFDSMKREMMEDPNCSVGDAATRILKGQAARDTAAKRAHIDALNADEDGLDAPAPNPTSESEEGDAATEVAAIVSIHSAHTGAATGTR